MCRPLLRPFQEPLGRAERQGLGERYLGGTWAYPHPPSTPLPAPRGPGRLDDTDSCGPGPKRILTGGRGRVSSVDDSGTSTSGPWVGDESTSGDSSHDPTRVGCVATGRTPPRDGRETSEHDPDRLAPRGPSRLCGGGGVHPVSLVLGRKLRLQTPTPSRGKLLRELSPTRVPVGRRAVRDLDRSDLRLSAGGQARVGRHGLRGREW